MFRSNSYDEVFSREMKNSSFAQDYFIELTSNQDQPMTVEEALRFTIRRMGTSEFANLAGIRKQTVDKFLRGERNPKRETLDKLLKPFRLKTILTVSKIARRRVA